MMPPTVSVVIKSYNHAKYIRQTIDSVLSQGFQDFEIIVTDDGSTDGTPDVVAQFSDQRIKLRVLDRNRGLSTAMNICLARASGKYIAILNSDDFALPGRLARQVACLDQNEAVAAVFCLPLIVDEQGMETNKCFVDFAIPLSFPNYARETWLRHFFFRSNCLCAPSAMIRRSAYLDAGPYDPRLTNLQDLDMWVRMLRTSEFHFLAEPLVAFRIRDDRQNLSAPRHDVIIRACYEHYRILKHYLRMEPEFLKAIFASDLAGIGADPSGPPGQWLAELALKAGSPPHRLFATDTLFDLARSDAEYARLREVTGTTDVFGVLSGLASGV